MAVKFVTSAFIVLFCLFSAHKCQNFIVLETPDNCKSGNSDTYHQYYDIAQLKCINCKESKGSQTVSTDKSSCVCQNGHNIATYFGGNDVTCQACASNEISSQSRWECAKCTGNFVSSTKQCAACTATNQIKVERQLNGQWFKNNLGQNAETCLTCDAGTQPSADGTRCERCDQILSVPGASTCSCPNEATLFKGGVCFRSADDLKLPGSGAGSVETRVTSWSDDSFDSAYLTEHLLAAYAMCKAYKNVSACQSLGNMCVMLTYAKSTGNNYDACKLYDDLVGTNRPLYIPELYYTEDTTRVLEDTKITTQFSFTSGSDNSKLKFKVAQYTLNGTFLGLTDVTGGTLQLCPDTTQKLNAAFTFGVQYSQKCTIPLSELWSKEPVIFYDMYLEYKTGDTNYLYKVPVVNRQVGDNSGSTKSSWTLNRRFYLVDNVLFKQNPGTSGSSTPSPTNNKAKYIRYASSMTLNIQLQTDTTEGKIYPPYLTISYKEAKEDDLNAGKSASVEFGVSYSMDQTKYNDDMSIAMGVLCALGVIYAGTRTWAWSKRAGKLGIDFVTLVKFVLHSCGTISDVFFVVNLGAAFWWIVFFKRQDVVFLLPQSTDEQTGFVAFLAVAFTLKCIEMIHMFVVQATIDIFLIDWERPKPVMSSKDGQKSEEGAVSIWRTYFVANEWNEIQTCRKINPILQLFTTVFFLHVVGFQYLASADPYSSFSLDSSQYRSDDSRVFRFALGACVFLIIGLIQWLFHTLFYERFICDEVREFVDLCSMANISVFIMQNAQYGYYIHGRSVHGRADTDMKDMYNQLKREEDNLCGHRGLLPNSEQQTFRAALPKRLRTQYDRVLNTLNMQTNQPASRMERGAGKAADSFLKSLEAYAVLNRFLSAFVDHSLRDLDYMVKDKLLFESILDVEFEDTTEKGFFYNDSGHSFDAVLFYGNETTLMIFDILFFSIVDLLAQNFVLAGCLTYLMDLILAEIRDSAGKKNLAKKTLVDERFLI